MVPLDGLEMVGPVKAVFSDAWYRTAALRPVLRAQVRIHRHSYRGQRWHVVQDLTSGQFLRFDAMAYRAISLMDGVHTVADIWHMLVREHVDAAPSQDDLIKVLTQLYQANLLRTDQRTDVTELVERGERNRWNKLKSMFMNPMSVRLPLFSPDHALGLVVGLVPPWVWKLLLVLWALLIAAGGVVVAMHWSALTDDLSAQVFTPEKLLWLVVIFPVLKAIHEFGHCLALKALGGTVHEVGLMFLIFVPIPYVEASQSYTFASKWQRMLVGASGMIIEVGVAAVCAMLWVDASAGLFKSVMHQTLILASVTTVLFNANPLLRFDGYYILSDWLEMPNLGNRANKVVQSWVKRRLFGVVENPPQETASELRWLVPYALGSHVYRLAVTFTIVLLVAEQYLGVGLVLAAWSLWNSILKPIYNYLEYVAVDPGLQGHRRRAVAVTGLVLATTGALACGVPVDSATNAEGVVWASEQSRIRVPVACFGDKQFVQAGERVKTGQPLFACSDPGYQSEVFREAARLDEAQSKSALARTVDRVQWSTAQSQVQLQQERLKRARERAKETVVLSPHEGWFVPASTAQIEGRYLARGEVIANVVEREHLSMMSVVSQTSVDMVRHQTRAVEVRLAENIWYPYSSEVLREVPAGLRELPSMALAIEGGGEIGLDPKADKQQSQPIALDHFFQFELVAKNELLPEHLGGRVYVRFEHPPEPIAMQWYRQVRQMFLRRFAV
jgi:putative peptide zinc metalloprotease protein